ncbi:MAG: cytochrome c-type biogenesis protein CcmH [Rhodobiaceae bacterium]|nr:cytochrome c-type biogenesis protein CcmH [Rhodobiaceae bacterium]
MTIRVASTKFNFLLISIYLCTYPVLAISPGEAFKDEALEARARSLSMELRCMVCQNQSIDDSDAPLAKDLRILIREQIKAGKTDYEILDFIEDRYGEFALLKPRFDIKNAPLWALPFLLILAGIFFMRSFFRNAPKN